MRLTGIALAVLSIAGAAAAQETRGAAPPDFSRPALMRVLSHTDEIPEQPDVQYHFGTVEFRALGSRWHIAYLPLMMPFSGSFNRGLGMTFPDPFALTGTPLPFTPRTWRDERALSIELRRIEFTERQKAKIQVKLKAK